MLKREALGLPTRHRNLGAQGMVKPAVGLLAMGVERKEFDRAAAGKHMPAAWIDVRNRRRLCVCMYVCMHGLYQAHVRGLRPPAPHTRLPAFSHTKTTHIDTHHARTNERMITHRASRRRAPSSPRRSASRA